MPPFGSSSPLAPNGASPLIARGLHVNNTAAPTTQVELNFNGASFIRPGNGAIVYQGGAFDNSCRINQVWNAIGGGRDQAGAFPNDSLVHFYLISDGAVSNAICSLTSPYPIASPPTITSNIGTMLLGPALPSGFTSWSYAGCWPMNGAVLYDGFINDSWFTFRAPVSVLNNGGNVALTALAIPAPVVSAAAIFNFNLKASVLTNAGGAAYSEARIASNIGGVRATKLTIPVNVPAALQEFYNSTFQQCENNPGATLEYQWFNEVGAANINTRKLTVELAGFKSGWCAG